MTNLDKIVLRHIIEKKDEELLLVTPTTIFKREIHKNIFLIIKSYYEKFNRIPSVNKIKELLKIELSEEKANFCVAWLEGGMQNLDEDYTSEELKTLIRKVDTINYFDTKIVNLVEAVKERDVDTVKSIVNNFSEKLTNFSEKLPVNVRTKEFKLDNIVMIEPFLKGMRESGLMFGGVTVIGSGSGFGKSIFVINQLMYSYERGESVCLFNLELGYSETIARMYSYATKTPFYKVYTHPEPGIEEKVNKWRKEYFNRENAFYIDDSPYDIYELESAIRLYAKKGVKIFAIDYLNLVEMPSHKEEWKSLASFIKKLHRLTRELGIVIITPTQVNIQDIKEKDNSISITTRGSRELEYSATVLLMLWRTKEEYENNFMRIFTIKARNAQSKLYPVETDFQHMRFIDTGIAL